MKNTGDQKESFNNNKTNQAKSKAELRALARIRAKNWAQGLKPTITTNNCYKKATSTKTTVNTEQESIICTLLKRKAELLRELEEIDTTIRVLKRTKQNDLESTTTS